MRERLHRIIDKRDPIGDYDSSVEREISILLDAVRCETCMHQVRATLKVQRCRLLGLPIPDADFFCEKWDTRRVGV